MTQNQNFNIFSRTAGWIGLVIMTLVLSTPSKLFPIAFIPFSSILLSLALYKEQKNMRSVSYVSFSIATFFCLFTFISSYYLDSAINLLNISFNPPFMITLLVLLALMLSSFIALAFCLVKIISKPSGFYKLMAFNFIFYITGFLLVRHAIERLIISQ